MVFVLEVPHTLSPSCWSVANRDALLTRLREMASKEFVFEVGTVAELMQQRGYDTPEEAEADGEAWLARFHREAGPGAVLYANHTERYQLEPISEFDAYLEWMGLNLSTFHIYESIEEAQQAVVEDWSHRHKGTECKSALCRELAYFTEQTGA